MMLRYVNRCFPCVHDNRLWDSLFIYLVLGIVVGSRLGYIFFYHPEWIIDNPGRIIQTWTGGMSYHGGVFGLLLGALLFTRKHSISLAALLDRCAFAAPFGLAIGRVGNFINAELYGRITSLPWGVVFPHAGPLPRHPSQLYEAFLEGVVMAAIMWIGVFRYRWLDHPKRAMGAMLIGYSIARILAECFREPDNYIGFIWHYFTWGQILTAPLFILGLCLWTQSFRKEMRT